MSDPFELEKNFAKQFIANVSLFVCAEGGREIFRSDKSVHFAIPEFDPKEYWFELHVLPLRKMSANGRLIIIGRFASKVGKIRAYRIVFTFSTINSQCVADDVLDKINEFPFCRKHLSFAYTTLSRTKNKDAFDNLLVKTIRYLSGKKASRVEFALLKRLEQRHYSSKEYKELVNRLRKNIHTIEILK